MTTSAPPCDSDTYGRLVRSRRIWAVAAIHGEAERITRLHQRLYDRLAPGDRLVYLGDYLGYGPEAATTLDALLLFRLAFLARPHSFAGDIVLLRGSQEEMWQKLMELQFAPNPREVLPWMLEHGVEATLRSYGLDSRQGLSACREGVLGITRWTTSLRAAVSAHPGHRQLLTLLRRAAFTDDNGVLFVNAGIDARKPLDLQGDAFWWGRTDVLALDTGFAGFNRVVRGYDRHRAGLVETQFAVSLDAGSGFGGPLLAGCFAPNGQLLERLEA